DTTSPIEATPLRNPIDRNVGLCRTHDGYFVPMLPAMDVNVGAAVGIRREISGFVEWRARSQAGALPPGIASRQRSVRLGGLAKKSALPSGLLACLSSIHTRHQRRQPNFRRHG